MNPESKCVKCGGEMQPGVVVQGTGGLGPSSSWAAITSDDSAMKERHPIQILRCSNCGLLEIYARN